MKRPVAVPQGHQVAVHLPRSLVPGHGEEVRSTVVTDPNIGDRRWHWGDRVGVRSAGELNQLQMLDQRTEWVFDSVIKCLWFLNIRQSAEGFSVTDVLTMSEDRKSTTNRPKRPFVWLPLSTLPENSSQIPTFQ